MANHKRTPLAVRLESRLDKSDANGCWIYTGCRLPRGYGLIGEGGDSTTGAKQLLAHRASWMIHRGQIPEGVDVCHKCDNPPCTNPEHLFLGSRSDNMMDCSSKGRLKPGRLPGGKNGQAKLSDADVSAIRQSYLDGKTQVSLAIQYGTAQTNISRIVRGESWKSPN